MLIWTRILNLFLKIKKNKQKIILLKSFLNFILKGLKKMKKIKQKIILLKSFLNFILKGLKKFKLNVLRLSDRYTCKFRWDDRLAVIVK
jgi:hypothetical protein